MDLSELGHRNKKVPDVHRCTRHYRIQVQLLQIVTVDFTISNVCLANSLDRLLTQRSNAHFLKHRIIARYEATVNSGFSNLCFRVKFGEGGVVGMIRSKSGSAFRKTCPYLQRGLRVDCLEIPPPPRDPFFFDIIFVNIALTRLRTECGGNSVDTWNHDGR